MKKHYFFTALMALAFGLLEAHAQLNKVALVSLYYNKDLYYTDSKIIEINVTQDSAFTLSPHVNYFHTFLNGDFSKKFPFLFVPNEDIVKDSGYKYLSNYTKIQTRGKMFHTGKESIYNYLGFQDYVPMASFGLFDDTEAIKKSFELLPQDVDGVMVAYISYEVIQKFWFLATGSFKIRAHTIIKIFNRNGKCTFKLLGKNTSNEHINYTLFQGIDIQKLNIVIEDANKGLFETMKKKLPKSLAKLAKKIAKDKED